MTGEVIVGLIVALLCAESAHWRIDTLKERIKRLESRAPDRSHT